MRTLIISLALLLVGASQAQQFTIQQTRIQKTSWASGQGMYREYCAVCHGNKGTGHGAAASAFKAPPADLTTLAERNSGKFPYDEFNLAMRFGTNVTGHGSKDMPVWEPLFASLPEEREAITQQRIYNLARFVMSLQSK